MRDRVASAKVVKEPTVELRCANVALQFLELEGHAPRGCDLCLCFVRKERQNISRLNSANLHAFHAAALTAEDSNSGFRRFQKRRQIFDHCFIRAILDGGRLNSQLERSLDDTSDFVAACTRLYAHRKLNTSILSDDVELLPGASSDATAGICRGGQSVTKRADTARAARSWHAVLARRGEASKDLARIHEPGR